MSPLIELMAKLVISVTLAFWLYRDARGRDFSWVFWVIIPFVSLLVSLFIAIPFLVLLIGLYLLTRPKGKMFSCPHCQKNIHEMLFVCPFCRKNAKHECLNCHEPVPWNDVQCPFCKSRNITKE